MTAETLSTGPGYSVGTADRQVVIRLDANLAMAIGDLGIKSLPGSESIATVRAQFAAALANAGFSALLKGHGWPVDARAFVQSHVLASTQEGD